MPVQCGSCAYENRLKANYCGSCGRPLVGLMPCSACGVDNPRGQRFCDRCGTPLGDETRPSTEGGAALAPETVQPRTAPEFLAPSPAAAYPTRRLALARVGVASVFVLAVFIRLYALGDIPDGLHSAEAGFRRAATQVMDRGWVGLWPETTGGQPAGLAYLMAGWMQLFGDTTASARLLAAWVGLASLGVFYLFCRSLLGGRAALFGSMLVALGVWHLAYSRLAVPAVLTLLLELVAAYLLLLALSEKQSAARQGRLLVLGGLSFGVGIYLHDAFFIFAVVVALLWAREFLAGEEVLRRSLAFFIPALMVALPYLGALVSDLSGVAGHVREVAVSSAPGYQDQDGVTEQSRYVLANIVKTAGAILWRRGSEEGVAEDGRHILDPVTALLAVIGLVASLQRWGERRHSFALIMVATVVVGVGLTQGPGMYGRLIVALPALFAAAGYGLHWLMEWMSGRVPEVAAYAVVAVLIGFVAWYNLTSYYGQPVGASDVLWGHAGHRQGPAALRRPEHELSLPSKGARPMGPRYRVGQEGAAGG